MTPSLTSLSNRLSLSRTVTRFPLALTLSLIFPCLTTTALFYFYWLSPNRLYLSLPVSLSPSPLSSTVMRFYLTLHSYSTYWPHRLYHHLHWLSTNRPSLTLTLYLCWSPPPPPLPSHHHGLFLCPLRSLSSQDQYTPLHYASMRGQMAVAELLVEKGADVDARDKVRPTLPPTHIAAASLFSRCCPFLTPSLSPFHTGSLLPLLVFPPSRDP